MCILPCRPLTPIPTQGAAEQRSKQVQSYQLTCRCSGATDCYSLAQDLSLHAFRTAGPWASVYGACGSQTVNATVGAEHCTAAGGPACRQRNRITHGAAGWHVQSAALCFRLPAAITAGECEDGEIALSRQAACP